MDEQNIAALWTYGDPIVISGLSGRMPQSDSVEEFIENLFNQEDMVESTESRWPEGHLGLPPKSGLIKSLSKFDATYFNLTPNQANYMDASQRIALEISLECIIDAGYEPENLRGKSIGVFLAIANSETEEYFKNSGYLDNGHYSIEFASSMFTNRITHYFGFKGPSVGFNSGSASTGIALHQAYLAIRNGLCEGAIVGALQTYLNTNGLISFKTQNILSPDGDSLSFDMKANGIVLSETIASLFLQKKCKAKRIYAELVHIHSTTAFEDDEMITSSPSRETQVQLLRTTYYQASLDPSCINYIEGDGTGELVRDQRELRSLREVFINENRTEPLRVGAVKSNCGHAQLAAGMNSIFKVCFIMEREEIPPNLYYEESDPNNEALLNGDMEIVTEPTLFESEYIGVNLFGMSGTNTHAIFKRNETGSNEIPHCQIPRLALFNGRTEDGLEKSLSIIGEPLKSPEYYALLQEVSNTPTSKMPYRGYTLINSTEPDVLYIKKVPKTKRPVWFIYSGLGSQWAQMAKHMMHFKVFENSIKISADILEPYDIDLFGMILDKIPEASPGKRSIASTLAAISSIQIALTDLLFEIGIEPDGMIGHSLGENTCSYADGSFTHRQTLLAAYIRGKATDDHQTELIQGAMAAIGSSWENWSKISKPGLRKICDNSKDSITIAGPLDKITECIVDFTAKDIFAKEVDCCGYPFHCEYIQPVVEPLRELFEQLVPDPKRRSPKWKSTSIPKERWNEPISHYSSSDYHVNNFHSPVLFKDALKEVPENSIAIEIGPHCFMKPILKGALASTCDVIGLMKKNHPNNAHFFLENIGRLYAHGIDLAIQNLYPPVQFPVPRNTPPLAHLLAWDHSKDWFYPSWKDFEDILHKNEIRFEVDINKVEHEYLFDNNIDDIIQYPIMGYLVLVWKAFAIINQEDYMELPVEFSDVAIHRNTVIHSTDTINFIIRITPELGHFEIEEADMIVASGIIIMKDYFTPKDVVAEDSSEQDMERTQVYRELKARGYNYGPAFQLITNLNSEATLGTILWQKSWETFLENICQIHILQNNSCRIFTPIHIRKLSLNPIIHDDKDYNEEISFSLNQNTGKFIAGGVELQNIMLMPVAKVEKHQKQIIETYQFIPYNTKIESSQLQEYIRVCSYLVSKLPENCDITNQRLKEMLGTFPIAPIDVLETYLESNASKSDVILRLYGDITDSFVNEKNTLVEAIEYLMPVYQPKLIEDSLNKCLLAENTFRLCLDVALENISSEKVRVCEITQLGLIYNEFINLVKTYHPSRHISYTISHQGEALDVSPKVTQLNWDFDTFSHKVLNFDIVVLTSSATDTILKCLSSSLKLDGFVLVIQRTQLTPAEILLKEYKFKIPDVKTVEELENLFGKHGYLIICKHLCIDIGVVYLLRLPQDNQDSKIKTFDIEDPSSINWGNTLKEYVKSFKTKPDKDNIWIRSCNTSGLIGLVNCMRLEFGGRRIRCIVTDSKELDCFKEVRRKDLVMNVFKDGQFGSYRYQSCIPNKSSSTELFHSVLKNPGDLSSLGWAESNPNHKVTERFCVVHFSALNTQDLMRATGKMQYKGTTCSLGIEFSGKNEDNQRVMGIVPSHGIATVVNTYPYTCWEFPEHWSMEQAATVPVAYASAYFALIIHGGLRKNHSILIHSGHEAVGQAAIRVALHLGCEMYITVEKKQHISYLKAIFPKLKDKDFSYSQSDIFEDHILDKTKGKGVNFIFNTLPEESMQASFRCLAKYGKFLQLRKYEFYKNESIKMDIIAKGISYHKINLEELFESDPNLETVRDKLYHLLLEGIDDGVIQPLDYTVLDKTNVEEAVSLFASGKYNGKILIKMDNEEKCDANFDQTTLEIVPKTYCDPKKCYIVIEGLNGLATHLIDWLIEKGATKIVHSSVSGIRNGYLQSHFNRWNESGLQIKFVEYDLSNEEDCSSLLEEASSYQPVGGIFDLDMLGDEGYENESSIEFYNANISAAYNLDKCSRKLLSNLSWYVLFSSIKSGRVLAGNSESNYISSIKERICEERVKFNLPGLAVQWIITTEKSDNENQILKIEEATSLIQKIDGCLETLDKCLQINNLPVLCSSIVNTKMAKDEVLRKKSLSKSAAQIFGFHDLSQIDCETNFKSLGMSSVMISDLQEVLQKCSDIVLSEEEICDLTFKDLFQIETGMISDDIKTNYRTLQLDLENFLLQSENLLRLNSVKSGTPIFMFLPILSSRQVFFDLAHSINRPVFGLASLVLGDEPDMANVSQTLLKVIKQIQSHGSYCFLAYSTGAAVAYNVALQMTAMGEIIDKLIFLDSSPQFMSPRFVLSNSDSTDEQKSNYILSYILYKTIIRGKSKVLKNLHSKSSLESKLQFILNAFYGVNEESRNRDDLKNSLNYYYKMLDSITFCEKTEKLKTNATLIKALNTFDEFEDISQDYELSQIIEGKITLFTIEDTRANLLLEENLPTIADIIIDI